MMLAGWDAIQHAQSASRQDEDPTLSTLEKLAKALGVKVGRLVE